MQLAYKDQKPINYQIKRTRMRLVAYIQVLSRAAYLPSRYNA